MTKEGFRYQEIMEVDMIEKLRKLGGNKLIKKFSLTFWLKDTTLFKTRTDKDEEVLLMLRTLRKILVGAPEWRNLMKGNVGKKEAADALLRWEMIPPPPRIGYKRALE